MRVFGDSPDNRPQDPALPEVAGDEELEECSLKADFLHLLDLLVLIGLPWWVAIYHARNDLDLWFLRGGVLGAAGYAAVRLGTKRLQRVRTENVPTAPAQYTSDSPD